MQKVKNVSQRNATHQVIASACRPHFSVIEKEMARW
jgi:hypothetical protein